MLDLIIRGGTVVDGSGALPFPADVGLSAGKISAIGDLATATAPTLDAAGMIVCPGFVDIHSHSDFTPLVDPRACSSIAQGVTTELVGNCGHGCAPITDAEAAPACIYGYHPSVPITWSDFPGYFEQLESVRPAINMLTLVPNGLLRLAVLGSAERPANPDELREMGRYLELGMDQGAFGFSTGLEYPIERASSQDNLIALCKIVARRGGLYAPHVRNRDTHAVEAVDEDLDTARAAGVRTHIPHLVPRRAGSLDTARIALDHVDAAIRAGVDVSIDMHTRPFGLTNLNVALPPSAFAGSAEQLRALLKDPTTRRAFAERPNMIMSYSQSGWDHVRVLTSARRPDLIGKSFAEIAEAAGVPPFDVVHGA